MFPQSRVRLSFKRRPPTRQRRKSTDEEGVPDTPEKNKSPCDLHSPDNTPDKNGSTKDALNVPQQETQETQETPLITVQDTELQDEHDDVTKDNEMTENTEEENKEEVAEEKCSGNPEVSKAVDNQLEEKAVEEHSTGEMEGSKSKEEETSGESAEENRDAKVIFLHRLFG